ncbi:MAG: phosphoglucosamine mutase [Actinobacteria bacterium]|nr:phosphoglucosamine mutase [Actinomycetota bacterium]
MERRYFGTDGIRGIVPDELTPEFSLRVGMAAQKVLAKEGDSCVVGCDTRISSDVIKSALVAGIAAAGGNVFDASILPTPGVSYLVKHFNLKYGGVVSASHNPYEYNGIKFFNYKGEKLSDEKEFEIEVLIDSNKKLLTDKDKVGRIYFIEEATEIYSDFLVSSIDSVPKVKVAFDCANGATSISCMLMSSKVSLDAVFINTEPDGFNINLNCGATSPETIAKFVVEKGLDGGFAFDGDGDRVIAVDRRGRIINGDQIIGFLAKFYKDQGLLKNQIVVGTIMSNYGLESMLKKEGIEFVRASVGDRYVLEEMVARESIIGGEDSGHIILLNKASTGDGLLVAATLLDIIAKYSLEFSDLISFEPMPRRLINVHVKNKDLFKSDEFISRFIEEQRKSLEDKGRIVVRPSGTEPLIRVMVEASSESVANTIAEKIAKIIEERLG